MVPFLAKAANLPRMSKEDDEVDTKHFT